MWDGKKYPMFCKIEIKNGKLSISGVIGTKHNGGTVGGCGQIDMEFDHVDKSENDTRYSDPIKADALDFASGWSLYKWYQFLHIWKKHHLNDLHAECIHQEVLGWTYDTHKGQNCPECGYKIGTAWTFRELPQDVVKFLASLPNTDTKPAWV